MMKFRFLNKTIEHSRFEYRPMYYDERKEKLERMKQKYAEVNAENADDAVRQSLLRENIRENWSRAHYRQAQQKSANFRTILLIGAILALGYFIFNGVDEVDTVVTKLW